MHGWKSFVCGGLILLSASVSSLTEAGTVTSNINVYNATSAGNKLIELERYEEAKRYFIAALNQEGTFAPAWLGLGVAFAYAETKDYDAAIDCEKKAIKFCDGDEQFKSKAVNNLSAYYYLRGNRYCDKGKYEKAIADYDQSLELDPNCSAVYTNRGNAYREEGNYDRAIVDYNFALEIDPTYAAPYYHRALAYKRKEAFEQALADCEAYLSFEPSDQEAKKLRQELLETLQKK